jgi:hypothetical protein
MLAAYRREGIELPLILNDAFTNVDSDRPGHGRPDCRSRRRAPVPCAQQRQACCSAVARGLLSWMPAGRHRGPSPHGPDARSPLPRVSSADHERAHCEPTPQPDQATGRQRRADV